MVQHHPGFIPILQKGFSWVLVPTVGCELLSDLLLLRGLFKKKKRLKRAGTPPQRQLRDAIAKPSGHCLGCRGDAFLWGPRELSPQPDSTSYPARSKPSTGTKQKVP